jgi:hypothetical protein
MKSRESLLRPYLLVALLVTGAAAATTQPSSPPKDPATCVPQAALAARDLPVTVLAPVHVRARAGTTDVLPRVHVVAAMHAPRTAQVASGRPRGSHPGSVRSRR